jgi:hypothetical protein
MQNYYKPGCWNVVCMVCGRQFKSDEVRKRWDGLIVCKSDYEERHIADFIRVKPETSTVPYTAPEPTDVFVVIPYFSSSAVADYALADVSIVGVPLPENI